MMGNKKDRTRTMSVKKQCVLDTPPAMQPKPNGLTTLKNTVCCGVGAGMEEGRGYYND